MAAIAELPFPAVRWDLTDLFSGVDDPRIEATWAAAQAQADAFGQRFRGRIASGSQSALEVLEAIRAFEAIYQEAGKPITYAHMLFSCDSGDPAIGAFLAAQGERYSALTVKLLFFELEIQDIPDEAFSALQSDPALAAYSHYLSVARTFRPHKLSEAEEVILEETANTGTRAWVRFFEELFANHVFRVTMPNGAAEELTEPEVLALLREPDRRVRQAAADSLSTGLEQLEKSTTFIYNTLLLDKKTGDRLRKHAYAEHSRHLSNELGKETVDMVVGLCVENYGLVERFYHRKRQLLGLDELTHVDRYAPLQEAKERRTFDEARQIVEDAIGAFSPSLRELTAEFFDKNWIDAEPRKGKQGGAYCNSITPDLHPVVFMNYQNKLDDVMTLAHELGHGVHGSLSRRQTYLNFHPTLPLAELASTFAEMLVFEDLVREATDEAKLALYAEKIEGIFATVFRQAAMFQFEVRAHSARREEGELAPERLNGIYQEEMQRMFGDSVKLGEQHRRWWQYVSHFFAVPFYVYAYSFGELLVLSLFERAKVEGPMFAAKYEEMLAQGGSKTPKELMEMVGVDISDRAFWQGGFKVMERMISTFEGLC